VSLRKPTGLGYEFTPIPRAAIRALADGRLDVWDTAILAAVYDRDVPRNLNVRFTLDQLGEWIAWPNTIDALSKRLRRLRDDGWLSYEQPRARPYRYGVTLTPEPPTSERHPRSNPANELAAPAPGDARGPSTTPSGPSSDISESDVATTPKRVGVAVDVRPGQRVQRNPSSLEEKVGPTVPKDPRAREASWPSGDQAVAVTVAGRSKLPEREQAILDEISDVFGGAREIAGPLPSGRVLERVERHGIVVELVAVDSEEFKAAKARGQYDTSGSTPPPPTEEET
jgi:hypothetical protein